jgi:23S rRNA (adenine2503-C2)-methyltransferase
MLALTDYDVDTLAADLVAWGFKPSHAAKILREFYAVPGGREVTGLWDQNFGDALWARLREATIARQSRITASHQSADGTVKLLIGLDRGGAVETVLMPWYHPGRAAGCVSSQIGCAMGCDFCASTRRGLERNLEAGEIVEQFLSLREEAAKQNRRVTSLVFMGMGEPMHNLDNVIAAIRRIAGPGLGELGWRHITVSTVGIVPGIDRLTETDLNVHLAISLHAPDDATRERIVPTGKRWRVADIMAAARRFEAATGRIPTIEYTLLAGVNDSDEQARLLADLMDDFRAHVNLIPYNYIGPGLSGAIYRKPDEDRMNQFLKILRDRRVVAHFRRTRGDDVSAACGQLRETLSPQVITSF